MLLSDVLPAPAFYLDDLRPDRLVSGNRRIHHLHRSDVCRYWRDLTHEAAVKAYGIPDHHCTWHLRIRVVLTFRFPDRRRRDIHNYVAYVAKPIVDGLVDAGVVPDDDDKHLIGPDLRRDPDRGPHRIAVHIEDLP